MNTLSIAYILKNLSYYQSQYLNILNQADAYYLPVEDAFIHLWPFSRQQLYLGDLLQLWFSQKWLIHRTETHYFESHSLKNHQPSLNSPFPFFYQIKGNLLTGSSQAKVCIDGASSYQKCTAVIQAYCVFKALKRPPFAAVSALKKTIFTV